MSGMSGGLLQAIISTAKPCYFISPHYDDAVLSAGALASRLKGHNKIIVINVFTQAGPKPYTLSAKAYLKQCNYTDAQKLYADRAYEDGQALGHLADTVINLGFTDALWRPKDTVLSKWLGSVLPEFGNVYPTYKFHIARGKVARSDKQTITAVSGKLASAVESKDAFIFCPLGVGNHIDHVITRLVCDKLFPNPLHWADYPYNIDAEVSAKAAGLQPFFFDQGKEKKKALIKKYASQYKALFDGEPSLRPEVFYYK